MLTQSSELSSVLPSGARLFYDHIEFPLRISGSTYERGWKKYTHPCINFNESDTLNNLLEQTDSGIGDEHPTLSNFEHQFDHDSLNGKSEYQHGYGDERRNTQIPDEETKGENDLQRVSFTCAGCRKIGFSP